MNPGSTTLPLRDIHLPDAVSWWPPAPGWWLLLIILVTLMIISPHVLKKLRDKPLNKLALQELDQIEAAYATHRNKQRLVQEISILLRRTCMSYEPRQQVASLTGEAWIERLHSLSNAPIFSGQLRGHLLTAPYNRDTDIDAQQLLQSSRQWLQHLPARKSS